MRLSLKLKDDYPRRSIWWMECDVCRETRSEPTWMQHNLALNVFRDLGWECGQNQDTCPACLALQVPICTCYIVPGYDALEPGSMYEPNPECPEHFPTLTETEK